jgi:hypothetical protein
MTGGRRSRAAGRTDIGGARGIEDLHWADPATLDVVRLLVRQAAAVPLALVVTLRDDSQTRQGPQRRAEGTLAAAIQVAARAVAAAEAAAAATAPSNPLRVERAARSQVRAGRRRRTDGQPAASGLGSTDPIEPDR